MVTPIRNQGSCGSCWAFAATAGYESLLAIVTNGTQYDLSEQYTLKCETAYSLGCNGGYPYRALQLLGNTGAPLESAYPYSPSSSAGDICTNTAGRVKLNQTVNAVNFYYFQNLTVEQLQQDLVTYGPINVGVYASDYSFSYAGSSGLISCSYSSTIDHAILLVGYNTTHWFVKNSWGTTWGHNGFGYISKTIGNDCNIRQYVNEMQINFDSSPTPPDPNNFNLNITMTDSAGDGWNGNVISVKQNNAVVGTFGGNFTSGSSSGPFYIPIQGGLEVQIVVSQLGTKSDEVGFTIKAPNGTIIHQRNSGTAFTAGTLFSTFCPQGGCPLTLMLNISMTDTYGDGWEGTTIGIRQSNVTVGTFGTGFTSGTASGPVYIWVQGNI